MRLLIASLLCCSLQVIISADKDAYCFSDDTDPYNFFATKTAYELVREKKLNYGSVPDCKPVMIWGLFRHGTRYPHASEVKQEMDLLNFRDSVFKNSPQNIELCNEDEDLLKGWSYNVNASQADLLTPSGIIELQLLAKRLRSNFPDVLNAAYTEDRFKVRYGTEERTRQSAEAFTTELFGSPIDLPESFVSENLMEPNKNCTEWKASTKSEATKKESEMFRKSELMNSMIWSISKRLGFAYNLTYPSLSHMYDMCRFDKAWNFKEQSPWCAVFEMQHLKMMEFDEDLAYYYNSGYGNSFTPRLGCPLVKDMIESLNNRALMNSTEEYGGPSAVLYFGHSLTVRTLLVKLGMAKDKSPLTAKSFSTSEKRQWRTAFLTPFAGNFLAVLYKCADNQYKVMFFLNEHYVEYEGCKVGLCDWSYIYSTFKPEIDPSKCNRDFCDTSGSTSIIPSIVLTLVTLFSLFMRQLKEE